MSDRENNQGMSDNWDSESYKEIGEESMSTDLMYFCGIYMLGLNNILFIKLNTNNRNKWTRI